MIEIEKTEMNNVKFRKEKDGFVVEFVVSVPEAKRALVDLHHLLEVDR